MLTSPTLSAALATALGLGLVVACLYVWAKTRKGPVMSLDSWTARQDAAGLLRQRWQLGRDVRTTTDWSRNHGYCVLCRSDQPMRLVEGASATDPNLREQLVCGKCGLNSRVRAALGLLLDEATPGLRSRVYVTEQATPTFVWMQRHLPGSVIGSEFAPEPARRAALTRYLRDIGGHGEVAFNDVTALDFADASLDAVVSFDVLEHVPDYGLALAEFARVLRAGGALIATFPFCDAEATVVRALLREDGGIEHLLEPEYHGDPISGGVLCWYHFGWDILAACRRAGFASASMRMPWDPAAGMHYGLWTLVARK